MAKLNDQDAANASHESSNGETPDNSRSIANQEEVAKPVSAEVREELAETLEELDDPELEGLTLYQKKSVLVDRELDRQGMGRYQWCVFFLCGFGYMLDLLWAQSFGIIVPVMQQEFGFDESKYGNIFSAFSAGLTIGAFTWGFLVDIIGRYWAFNFTVLWAAVFGLVLGIPDSYFTITILTAFLGFGIGGNIPIDTTVTLECLPQNRRWLLPALSIFQPFGVVLCCLIAYGFIPRFSCDSDLSSCNSSDLAPGAPCCTKSLNYGWRYVLYTLGALTLAVFCARFFLFSFQESPKYLLYRQEDEKAVKSLQHIAEFNKRESVVTLETFSILAEDHKPRNNRPTASTATSSERTPLLSSSQSKSAEPSTKSKLSKGLERYKMFFATAGLIRLTVVLWLIYAFDFWAFTIAGSFLPKILAERGSTLTLEERYRSYVIIYSFGVPGVLAGSLIYGHRRISMLTSSALFGASLFVMTVVRTKATYIGINGLVYFFQSMFNAILYGATPEFFPAPIRGTASGVASFWGRVFSILAPIAAAKVMEKSLNGVLYLAGAGGVLCTLLIFLLPSKYISTKHKH